MRPLTAAFGLPARKGWAFGWVLPPACTNRRLSALGTFPAVFVIAIAAHYTQFFLFVKSFFPVFFNFLEEVSRPQARNPAPAGGSILKKLLTNQRRKYNIIRVRKKSEKRIEKGVEGEGSRPSLLSESPRRVKAGVRRSSTCHSGAGAQKSRQGESRASREAASGPRDLSESSSGVRSRAQPGWYRDIRSRMSSPETYIRGRLFLCIPFPRENGGKTRWKNRTICSTASRR